MAEPRLASYIRVSALNRLATSNGDSLMVLRRGDAIAGALLLIILPRGQNPVLYEYVTGFDGIGGWRSALTEANPDEAAINHYCEKRSNNDSDLWLIELSIADDERLALYLTLGA
jgi:hypothetical protein